MVSLSGKGISSVRLERIQLSSTMSARWLWDEARILCNRLAGWNLSSIEIGEYCNANLNNHDRSHYSINLKHLSSVSILMHVLATQIGSDAVHMRTIKHLEEVKVTGFQLEELSANSD